MDPNLKQLGKFSAYELEDELKRRKRDAEARDKRKIVRERMEEMKKQAPCALVGRAYTGTVQRVNVLNITIGGKSSYNSGRSLVLDLSPRVFQEFENGIPNKNKFFEMLSTLAKAWIVEQVGTMDFYFEMVHEAVNWQRYEDDDEKKLAYALAIVDTAKKYSKAELVAFRKTKGRSWWHGQEVLRDTIKYLDKPEYKNLIDKRVAPKGTWEWPEPIDPDLVNDDPRGAPKGKVPVLNESEEMEEEVLF